MTELSPLMASILAEFSLSSLPLEEEITAMTEEQQSDLRQRLHDVIVAFRDRSHTVIEALRQQADAFSQSPSPSVLAPAKSRPHPTAASALARQKPLALSAPPTSVPRIDNWIHRRTSDFDARLQEIDEEITTISRRYRNIGTAWKRVRDRS
jgi:hypothetical protein